MPPPLHGWCNQWGSHSTFRDPSHTAALLFYDKEKKTLNIYKDDLYNLCLHLLIIDHAAPKVVLFCNFFFLLNFKGTYNLDIERESDRGRGWG